MEQIGFAALSVADIETLAERLMHEATNNKNVSAGRAEVGARARV
jgi:hypothetical protein